MRRSDLDYAALGERLRNLRRARKLTQEELAELAEVSVSFIGHIERGEKKSSLETIVRLCDVFNVPADYLLRGKMLTCVREDCPLYVELSQVFNRY